MLPVDGEKMFDLNRLITHLLDENETRMLKIIYSRNGSGTWAIIKAFGSHELGARTLKKLEEKGLIRREKGKRNEKRVFLTDYGEAVCALLFGSPGGTRGAKSGTTTVRPEVKRIIIGDESYISGDDLFKCYEWCESQGKHGDEFDACVKACVGVG
mgnify:FL=1